MANNRYRVGHLCHHDPARVRRRQESPWITGWFGDATEGQVLLGRRGSVDQKLPPMTSAIRPIRPTATPRKTRAPHPIAVRSPSSVAQRTRKPVPMMVLAPAESTNRAVQSASTLPPCRKIVPGMRDCGPRRRPASARLGLLDPVPGCVLLWRDLRTRHDASRRLRLLSRLGLRRAMDPPSTESRPRLRGRLRRRCGGRNRR